MGETGTNKTLNLLVGISVVMRISLLAWQLHRMYRLEKAEKATAQTQDKVSSVTTLIPLA